MSRIDIRLTEEEKQQIAIKAKECNMTVSDYIRFVALNAEIEIKIKAAQK